VTIRKGEDWGIPGALPDGAPVAATDRELALLVQEDHEVIGLTGGDLARTCGATGRLVQHLPIDVIDVVVDSEAHLAVANVVARASWWRGRAVGVMNAQFLGRWDVAPRSHPNDGRADVLDIDPAMTRSQRWQARSRLPTGTHVPHPLIAQRRITEWHTTFDPPLDVWLDGERVMRRANELHVAVRPDALTIVI
jgi:hypothetical protein